MSVGLKANSDGSGAVQTGGTDAIQISTSQAVTFPNAANLPNTFGFKNRLINGAMGISQRGTSFSTPASGTYTLDRWQIQWAGAAPASVAQVAGPTGFRNALQITGAASNTSSYILQRIESYNCSDLSGATITIQANIACSSAQTVLWQLYYPTVQDNYTGTTFITGGTWSATTTATTFTATITGLPSGATNGLQLIIGPNNAGAFTSGTITITGVQLEKGSTATSFDYRPYGTELALCQRYYFRITPGAVTKPLTQSGWIVAGNSCIAHTKFPVTMRTAPTALEQSGTANQYSIVNLTSVYTCNAVPTFTNANTESSITTLTTASAITAGQGGAGYTDSTNGATAYLGWSAEL